MSQKQAKKKRREEKEKQAAEEKRAAEPIGTITINVYANMDVNVINFPSDHNVAMMIMCNALMKVSNYFIQQSINNHKSKILLASQGASPADIRKMAAGN